MAHPASRISRDTDQDCIEIKGKQVPLIYKSRALEVIEKRHDGLEGFIEDLTAVREILDPVTGEVLEEKPGKFVMTCMITAILAGLASQNVGQRQLDELMDDFDDINRWAAVAVPALLKAFGRHVEDEEVDVLGEAPEAETASAPAAIPTAPFGPATSGPTLSTSA